MTASTDLEPRTYFSRIENALADFAPPLETIPTIIEAVRSLQYSHIFIPESRAYIGFEIDDGREPIAYVMPHVIALHPRDGVSSFIPLLPENDAPVGDAPAEAGGGPSAIIPAEPAPEPAPGSSDPDARPVCPQCFTNLPATGHCDYCDQ